jgi:hypothetical protein
VKYRLAPTLALASALFLFGAVQGTHAAQTPTKTTPRAAPRAGAKDPKEALARKVMDLSGAGNMGKQVLDAMMEQFKQMPNLPPGFADKFKEMARAEDIVDLVVPVYVKNYDSATLQAVIDFYESDGGRAFAAKQPQVVAESQRAGQQWGMQLAQKVMSELQKNDPSSH